MASHERRGSMGPKLFFNSSVSPRNVILNFENILLKRELKAFLAKDNEVRPLEGQLAVPVLVPLRNAALLALLGIETEKHLAAPAATTECVQTVYRFPLLLNSFIPGLGFFFVFFFDTASHLNSH